MSVSMHRRELGVVLHHVDYVLPSIEIRTLPLLREVEIANLLSSNIKVATMTTIIEEMKSRIDEWRARLPPKPKERLEGKKPKVRGRGSQAVGGVNESGRWERERLGNNANVGT